MASWGGYSFIINLLPIHCLACVVTGRLTPKLYIAYAPFVVLGTLTAGEDLLLRLGIPSGNSQHLVHACSNQTSCRHVRCMQLTLLTRACCCVTDCERPHL